MNFENSKADWILHLSSLSIPNFSFPGALEPELFTIQIVKLLLKHPVYRVSTLKVWYLGHPFSGKLHAAALWDWCHLNPNTQLFLKI